MLRFLSFALLVLFGQPVQADDVLPVKIGDTEIKLSRPPGMLDLPKDDPMYKAAADLTPPNCTLLRICVSSEALDVTKAPDSSADILTSRTFVMKDALMDIDSGTFIDFVEEQAHEVTHGVLKSQDSSFDFVETQKRLDDFQKNSGIGMQDASDIYSLGMVSRSDGCIAFMTAQYINQRDRKGKNGPGKMCQRLCIRPPEAESRGHPDVTHQAPHPSQRYPYPEA